MRLAIDLFTGIGTNAKKLALEHDVVFAVDHFLTSLSLEDIHNNIRDFPYIVTLKPSPDYLVKAMRDGSVDTLVINNDNEDVIRYVKTLWIPKVRGNIIHGRNLISCS